jgi:signal transduction histidine kinase
MPQQPSPSRLPRPAEASVDPWHLNGLLLPSPGEDQPPRWPLSHAGALELLAIAAAAGVGSLGEEAGEQILPGPDSRVERLSALISLEPGLAAWVIDSADRLSGRQIRTQPQAAEWLAGYSWPLPWKSPAAEIHRSWIAIASMGMNWAALATSIAEQQLPTRREEARWLAVQVSLRRWLPADERTNGSALTDLQVPGWLAAEFAAIELASPAAARQRRAAPPHSAETTAQCVAQACFAGLDRANMAAIRIMRDRWVNPGIDASWVPEVLARLHRLDRLERDFQRELETEKLAALKELAHGAGHEINNPLANISARAQTLLEDETDPERRRRLAAINSQAFRAYEMIADLMLFARPPQPQLSRTDIGALLAGIIDKVKPTAAEQQTVVEACLPSDPLFVMADPTQISVALLALCSNALEALGRLGRLLITLEARNCDGQPRVIIRVSDDGPGISPEVRRHLFDPFYSGREAGRGLGFGLSKCWRIVTAHGGRIEVICPGGIGTEFVILLPAAPSAVAG